MKTKLLFVLFLGFLSFNLNAQLYKWTIPIGAVSSGEEVRGIAYDTAGNVYATGFYSNNCVFGTTTYTTNSGTFLDVYVAKYDPSGNVLWAKQGTHSGSASQGLGICADNTGNVYATGNFDSPSTFTFGTYTLTNNSVSGYNDAYLVKYDPNGNVIWAQNVMNSTNDDRGNSVRVQNR